MESSRTESRGHLLVIDGTAEASSLIRMLEQDGYFCVQARGPIRVRSLLEEHPIDLIVWREEPGNSELIRDILQECARFPEVPIVHLFDRAIPSPSVVRHPQIRESLPSDAASARILTLLNRFFDRPEPVPSAPAAPKTELAFRNLVSTILQHRNESPESGHAFRGEIQAPLTSINVAERQSLASTLQQTRPSPLRRWLRRLFGRR